MSVSPISRPLLSPPKSLDGSGDDILSLAIESKDEKEILAILAKSYELTLQLRDGLPGQEDPWSCNFTDEAFLALTEELQKKIYRMANICGNEPLVDRLNGLGMRKEIPRLAPRGISVLSTSMDATDVSKAVHAFFLQQRKKGCLLTTAEFEGVKKSSGLIFRSKNRLSRIIGRDYIEAKAAELQLTNLKAPKKLIVINRFAKKIVVDIASTCGSLVLMLESGQGLKIFAEEIEEDNRLISFKEAEELITLIEASGFSDIKAANFIIAKDGIYFVDTEFNSFAGCFGTLFRLESMVRPEDQPKIRALIDERIKIAARNKGSHSAKEEFKHMEYFGLSERRPFHFTAQQLTTDLDKEIEEQGQHLHEERHL